MILTRGIPWYSRNTCADATFSTMNPTCTLLGSNQSLFFILIYLLFLLSIRNFYLFSWTSRGSSCFGVHEKTFRNLRSYWNLFLYAFFILLCPIFSLLLLLLLPCLLCVFCVNICRTSILFCNFNTSDSADVSV